MQNPRIIASLSNRHSFTLIRVIGAKMEKSRRPRKLLVIGGISLFAVLAFAAWLQYGSSLESLVQTRFWTTSFPESIPISANNQAREIGNFIDRRASRLEHAFQALETYSQLVEKGDRIPSNILDEGRILLHEKQKPTASIVESFPEAAYLSAEDKDFVARKLMAFEERMRRVRNHSHDRVEMALGSGPSTYWTPETLKAHGLEGARSYSMEASRLIAMFEYAHVARDYLLNLNESQLNAYARTVFDELSPHDLDVWQAFLQGDDKLIAERVGERFGPIWTSLHTRPRDQLSLGLREADQRARDMVFDFFYQELVWTPSNRVSKHLELHGFNAYVGVEEREQIRNKLIAAMSQVRAAPE